MGIDLSKLKARIISKLRKLTGELSLSDRQKQLLKDLLSPDEPKQMEAAIELGKEADLQLFCMLHFYMQDDFLDDFMMRISGREFRYEFAQKKMVKFYSLVAASNMLSQGAFFEALVGAIKSKGEPLQERCDIIYMMGKVFEAFGKDIHARESAFTSEKIGGLFIQSLLGILGDPSEPTEIKIASAMALSNTVQNPSIRTDLPQNLASEVFGKLQQYSDVLKG
ncbi:MAG: hypothetical protein N3F07_01245 [Candidatus Micrarchaeota archaeon]|nr:hypothetical protein [Candidatus Micrarchaeota archaeon]